MAKRIRYVRGMMLPKNTVYVGRPSRFGNPFRIGSYRGYNRADALRDYEAWLKRKLTIRSAENVFGKPPTTDEIRRKLRGKNLACWCPLGAACHADLLLKIANG